MTVERQLVRRAVFAVVLVAIAAGVFFVGSGAVPCAVLASQPTCDVAVQPGPSENALPLITVDGAEQYPPADGELHMTTIAVQEHLGWWEWLTARSSRVVEVVGREVIFPDEDPEDAAARNAAAMADSQLVATVAALRHLGHDLPGEGAKVVGHAEDTVAAALEVGDVITAIDGEVVEDSQDAVDQVRARAPGDTVELAVTDAEGATRNVEVELGTAPDDRTAYVGVLLTTELELPIDVAIDAGEIGGPSAGLVFALTLVELLEPDQLLDGHVIAGTGTITVDGDVGPVGGVPQKLAGVTSGVAGPVPEAFLVPRANLVEARRAVVGDDVLLVPIDDLADAVAALDALRDGREPQEAEILAAGG